MNELRYIACSLVVCITYFRIHNCVALIAEEVHVGKGNEINTSMHSELLKIWFESKRCWYSLVILQKPSS